MRAKRRKDCRRERGYTVLLLFMLIVFVGVALGQMVVTSTYGTLAARRSRDALTVRLAAGQLLNRPAPAPDGGSVYPDAPISGWSELVVVDAATGRIALEDEGEPAGYRILRQWRTSTDGAGRRMLAVSAVAVDGQHRPVEGANGASVVLARSVKQ
jgi:hypothetical protein